MPASAGNQAAIERELSASDLATLSRLCEWQRVDPDRWTVIPALFQAFAAPVAWSLVERVQRERSCSRDRALTIVEVRLGISRDTIRSWHRRWHARAA